MKRYYIPTACEHDRVSNCCGEHREDPDGEWCKAEDVAAEFVQLRAACGDAATRIRLLEALLRESVPFIESTVSGIDDGEAVALLTTIERALPA